MKRIKYLLALSIIGTIVSSATAQEPEVVTRPPNATNDTPAQRPEGIKLSEEQRAKMQEIRQAEQQKIQQIRMETREAMKQILTPEQQAKMSELRDRRGPGAMQGGIQGANAGTNAMKPVPQAQPPHSQQ